MSAKVVDGDARDTLDAGRFEAYLAYRMPDAAPVRVVELTRFARGVSRETWFAKIRCEGTGRDEELVVRRDLRGGSVCPTPLRREFEIYRRLGASAIPIAPVRWYEDSPDWLLDGREFYVREQVDGTWEVADLLDPDPAHDALRIEVSKEHVRKLALVHTCDWERLGFGEILDVPPDPAECATTAIDRLERTLSGFQLEPLPVVTEGIEWLRDHAPRDAPRVCLLKGTNGLGEEVFRAGEIVALSDWELASLGDPASDFAYLQDLVPGLVTTMEVPWTRVPWGLTDALEYYEQVSGLRVTPERIAYYRVLNALEAVVFAHHAAVPLTEGTDLLARLAWVSTEVQFWAQYLLASAAGVLAAEPE